MTAITTQIRNLKKNPCQWPAGHESSIREMPCPGGYRVLYKVVPDTGSNQTAGNVVVLRVYGPRQNRRTFDPSGTN
jgi:hypothetical protein